MDPPYPKMVKNDPKMVKNDPKRDPPRGGDPPPQGPPPPGGGTPPQKVKKDPPGPKNDPLTWSATKNGPEKSPMKMAKKLHNQGGGLGVPFFDPKMDKNPPPRGGVPPPTPKMIKMTPPGPKNDQNDPKMVKNDPKWDPQRVPPPSTIWSPSSPPMNIHIMNGPSPIMIKRAQK